MIKMIISGLLLMTSPFLIVMLWFKMRGARKEFKALKKEINKGEWARSYEYRMSEKFQKKLDKHNLKASKKADKLVMKRIKKASLKEITEMTEAK